MANATATELQQLYIAYFGRAADPTGLDYWVDAGTSTKAFAAHMHAQNEFKSVYGDLSVEAQVNQIYQNLFGRDADVTGLTYWTNEINQGNLELASIANDLIWAVNNSSATSGQTYQDKTCLSNKTSAATAYTAKVEETTAGILAYAPADSDPWDAGANITEAKSYMSGIDKDTESTSATIATSVSIITTNGVLAGAKTYTLTTGVDSFTGTNAADTFDASTSNTFLNGDTLVGGSGKDTLNATLTGVTVAANTSGIETYAITVTDTTASAQTATINMASATDVTTVKTISSTLENLTLNNLQSVITFESNTSYGTNTINFANSAMSSSSDDFLIKVDGTGTGAGPTFALTVASGASNTIETVSINSGSSANTIADLQTTGVTATTLEITGDQNLTITAALDSEITTVSASAATGDLSFAVANATGNTVTTGTGADTVTSNTASDSLTLGAGADTAKVATGNLVSTATIAAGAGTDILELTDDNTVIDADFTNITNVETLTAAADKDSTFTLGSSAAAAGIATVTLTGETTGDTDSLTVQAGFTTDLTVNLDDDAKAGNTVDATNYTKALTINADDDELDTNASTLTGGTGTSDKLVITAGGSTSDLTSISAIETYEISGTTSSTTMTLVQGNAADGATLTIDGSSLTTGVLTVDAEADTDGKIVITGGAGDDQITGSASDNGDSLTGNAGADTFTFATEDFSSIDTVSGGAGTDIVSLSNDNTVIDADFTNVTNVETLTSADDKDSTFTLSSLAAAAGISTVTLAGEASLDSDSVTIQAGFTNNLTVNLDDDANVGNVVDATNYTKTLTIVADDDELATNISTLTGGTGTADEIQLTAVNETIAAAQMAKISAFEKITTVGNATATSIEIHSDNVASGKTMTVDASTMTTAVLTYDASSETDGHHTITTLGTGAHIITLGQGNDTYTSTNTAGVNTVIATAGNNTITTGAGADIITMGAGNDNITSGAEADLITVTTGYLSTDDTINAGAGTDVLTLSNDNTVVDADFTNVTNLETLTAAAEKDSTFTLGSLAAAAGITTVTFTGEASLDTDSLTIQAGFTNDLTVNLDDDATHGNVVDATNYTKTLTIVVDDDEMATTASTLTGGTGTADEIQLAVINETIAAAQMAKISAFEKITTTGNATATSIETHDQTIAATKSLTVDASTMTTAVLTFDASSESDGTVSITTLGTGAHIITLGQGNDTYTSTNTAGINTVVATGGNNTITTAAAADIITLGSGNDNITSGAEADLLTVSTSSFNASDTINSGAGTDVLTLSDDNTVIDTDFTNVTNLETLTAGAEIDSTFTLGASAAAAGISTVTFTGEGSSDTDSLTIQAGFTNDLTVNLDDDVNAGNVVDATNYTKTLTIVVDDDEMATTASTLTGGTGTADEIQLAVINETIAAAQMAKISAFEKITTTGNATATSIEIHSSTVASGKTMTVDASTMTTAALTYDASSETDGAHTITAVGTGAHIITLGQGNDSYTSTSTGVDTVIATAGTNTIITGGGVDIVTSGSGVDTMTLNNGTSAAIANKVTFATAALGGTACDVITDFTATGYVFNFDESELSSSGNLITLKASADETTASSGATTQMIITAAADLGSAAATTAGVLVVNGTIATTDALETALEATGDFALTVGGDTAVNDVFITAYDDGTDSYIATVRVLTTTANNTQFGSGALEATNIVKLSGVANATSIAAGDWVIT